MDHLRRGLGAWVAVPVAILAVVALAACGSDAPDATTLLKQTFVGSHRVNSGNLALDLTVDPSGSSTITGPITLSIGGPFQSLGPGRIPRSNFTVRISALGRSGSLGLLSTGTSGYVAFGGSSYQLPNSTFQRLASSFSTLASSGGNSNSSGLSKLGIHPLNWLVNPTIVGDQDIAGTATTHIRAGVNVGAFVDDLGTLLRKAAATGVTGASSLSSGLSASTGAEIANEIKSSTVDVWTGKSDKTLRRLTIELTLPVSGQISTSLGGMRSAQIGLTMQYAELNQPQTITAPTTTRPYSEFAAKVRTLLQGVPGGLGGAGGGGGAGATPGSGSSGSGGLSGSNSAQAYSRCIQTAGNDVTKMQRCAPLLNGG